MPNQRDIGETSLGLPLQPLESAFFGTGCSKWISLVLAGKGWHTQMRYVKRV